MRKIFIDAGHGGQDSGAVAHGVKEKDIVLDISKRVVEELQNYYCEVYVSREKDEYITLDERCRLSNNNKCDIFISIHCNSYKKSDVNGLEVFGYSINPLVKDIYSSLSLNIPYSNLRGCKTANYKVLRDTTAKACLIEIGFISNYKEMYMITTNKQNIANAIVKGIVKNLSLEKKERKLYKVCVGAYQNKSNADTIYNHLKSDGYEPYIVYE